MRVKSEERRQAIMEAAAEVFREQGFSGASMATISARVGGSKATLYSYFTSKEELFVAVTLKAMKNTADAMLQLLEGDVIDIRTTLMDFAKAYQALILTPQVLTTTKIGISPGVPDTLGPDLYENGPGMGWRAVSAAFTRYNEAGILRIPDAKIAALQFKALLETGLFEPLLFGTQPLLPAEEVRAAAVDMFMLKYGVATV